MTIRIDDPLLAKQLKSLLQGKNLRDSDYRVSVFDEPDKSDPLNKVAIMSASTDNGVKRGWKVKTPTENIRGVSQDMIIETLLADLASEINTNPEGQSPV